MYKNKEEIPGVVHSVTLTTSNIIRTQNFIIRALKIKETEHDHIVDSGQELKRWFTGIGAELALEQFFGKKFVNLSVGKSGIYKRPDLDKLGLPVGIKCVEYGKHHIIYKSCHEPEILIFRDMYRFDIIGLATVDVLTNNQNDKLILSAALRKKGYKTGFDGYQYIIPFSSLKELKDIVNEN